MTFDSERFLSNYHVPIAPGGHKHTRAGWVQVECPFCTGNPGYHLGHNTQEDYWNCWRCGFHSHMDVIRALARCSFEQAKKIFREYGGRPTLRVRPEINVSIKKIKVSLPFGSGPLQPRHKQYLENRNFDPEKLESVWGLQGTGTIGPYRNRIIAPIYHRKRLVSFQGRDITGLSNLRYKACPKHLEAMDHKHVLYGLDLCKGMDQILVAEGITETWRFGPGSVATFGIAYTTSQIRFLGRFPRVYVVFDPDPQAVKQADKLAAMLDAIGTSVHVIDLGLPDGSDPAELSQDDADNVMLELGF